MYVSLFRVDGAEFSIRSDQTDMINAHDVVDLLNAAEGLGIAVWIGGGWGVDALVGSQTRHTMISMFISNRDMQTALYTCCAQKAIWRFKRSIPPNRIRFGKILSIIWLTCI